MNSKIAVVIRHYSNRAQFLNRILNSLKNQSFQNIVICILNMDNKRLDVSYYNTHLTQDLFQYLDRHGIRYISILDDDDTLAPAFFSRVISVIDNLSFESVKAITTHTNKVFELCEGNRIRTLRTDPLNHHLKYGVISLDTLRYRDALRLSSCVFDYDCFKLISKNHDLRHPSFFWPFIINFGAYFDIWLLEEAMAFYHIREFPEFSSANYTDKNSDSTDIYIRIKLNELYRSSENIVLSNILERIIFP